MPCFPHSSARFYCHNVVSIYEDIYRMFVIVRIRNVYVTEHEVILHERDEYYVIWQS